MPSSQSNNQSGDWVVELVIHSQILACIRWLSDFQVLRCIPLSEAIAFSNVAELAGISEADLARVVRMTATAGFLREPERGLVAHTPLSAQFVASSFLPDAAMFAAETALPAAQRMPEETRSRQDGIAATGTLSASLFAARHEREPRLRRQWAAYQDLEASILDEGIIDVLASLTWDSLGSATVVEVGARGTSVAEALGRKWPCLQFLIQIRDGINYGTEGNRLQANVRQTQSPPKIVVQNRELGAPQEVKDAAAYILHLPSPSPLKVLAVVIAQITAELKAHFNLLRANPRAILILVTRVLPEPGSVDLDVEAMARVHDMSLLQLANERGMEVSEILRIIDTIGDGAGKLVVTNRLSSHRHVQVAFQVQIQSHAFKH